MNHPLPRGFEWAIPIVHNKCGCAFLLDGLQIAWCGNCFIQLELFSKNDIQRKVR